MAGWPAVRAARRAVPLVIALYRRWERLPEHEKERYRRMARDYYGRGREIARRRGPKRK